MSGTMMNAAQQRQQARVDNMMARNAITSTAAEFCQQIFSTTLGGGAPVAGQVVNVIPRNVGLITGFLVRVDVDVVVPAGVTLARTAFGGMNVLSRLEFIDLANLTRVSTTGYHLSVVSSARNRRAIGCALTSDTPLGFNAVEDDGIVCPPTVAAGTTQTVSMIYELPLAYSRDDLRGAIYAAVVNATMALNLTINPVFVTTTPSVSSVYTASGPGTVVQNAKVRVYQRYYEQLPYNQTTGGPLLPFDDLSIAYQLQQTALTGLTVGQDFPIPYSNFRQFLSTLLVLDQGGTVNPGTDVNFVAMQTANSTTFSKKEPWVLHYENRNQMDVDLPFGMYLLDHRRRPVDTVTYGNQSVLINPSLVAGPSTQVLVGWEFFAKQSLVNATGSLAAG